ncbi:MAG: UDP-N-acetylmuramate--L-alanine ligase [Lachnospiraceae bacterium]|nr:UDP-N-acetylmuramate--L-alanine ligase [Candidatus Equihabitans merdae]
MYKIDFNKPIHLHFIGIGGISMSGLAEILLKAGFTISGSDSTASELTDSLTAKGAKVIIGQAYDNITDDVDAVVFTAAIHPDNPEYQGAVDKQKPMLTRAELLGQIMKNYGTPISVAGTHGKTTTTSMVSQILLSADCDPTISVGGMMPAIGGNIRVGDSPYFVMEACEYTNSFLSFFPRYAVILNVDADHLDFFKDLDDIACSFHRFAALVPNDGAVIINKSTQKFDTVTDGLTCPVITYAIDDEEADYYATDITYNELGCATFDAYEKGMSLGNLTLGVPGRHNVENALSAIAVSRCLELDLNDVSDGLTAFTGTDRRFQKKGEVGGVTIIDDYAHHPTEIKATLTSAASCKHRELYLAFQPHTYTRTKALFDDFVNILKTVDHVILADIYAAREKNTIGISSEDLAVAINEAGGNAIYLSSFGEIEDFVLTNCVDGDMFITMGAGDIYKVGNNLIGG